MDEIIVVSNGKAVERGPHAELLKANGMYRKLWDDQLHQSHHASRMTTMMTMTKID
jgi:ATP-binding cassette subfamily B protein